MSETKNVGRQRERNRLEKTARRIAAQKTGLVKDPDGLNLPDDLWQQALPEAKLHALRVEAAGLELFRQGYVAFPDEDPDRLWAQMTRPQKLRYYQQVETVMHILATVVSA